MKINVFGILQLPGTVPTDRQNGPQSCQTNVQKLVQKMTPTNVKIKTILGLKMGNLGEQWAQSQEAGAILKALVSKMAPRWLKTSPNNPR